MQTLGHFIVRLVAIFFGLFVAMLAAGIFLAFGLFAGAFADFFTELELAFQTDLGETGPLVAALVMFAGFITSIEVFAVALFPATVAIVIAELARWRGLTINLLLGGVVALAAGTSGYAWRHEGLPSDGTLVVLLATGFIAGFFYWLIAGRSAGMWLDEGTRRPQ